MYIAINYEHKGKMPPDMGEEESKQWWNKFNGAFTNRSLTIKEFIACIRSGYAYTAQHNRYRSYLKNNNFVAAQHLALDFDSGDERSTFEYLVQNPFITNHAAFLHTTPSHTLDKPRCRVVFVLDRHISDGKKFTLLAESLVYYFGLADQSCKDACRLFFGSEGCEVLELGNILTLETAAKELVTPYKQYQEKREQEHRERLRTMQVLSAGEVPQRILEAHIKNLLGKVQTAVEGQKYGTLRDISRTIGGYVGGGYYNRLDVEDWLRAAITSNSNTVKNLQHAYATISQGLDYGASEPLTFEIQRPKDELGKVYPPLSPEQKQQVSEIIKEIGEKRYWEGYHDGMTIDQREQWHNRGFTDYVIDHYGLGFTRVNVNTGEIVNALTVPFYSPDRDVLNVEYRQSDGGMSYEYELMPPLLFTDELDKSERVVLFDDSIQAITAQLFYGHADGSSVMAGMPYLQLSSESFEGLDDRRLIVVISPETDITGRGLACIRDRARFVRLPFTVERMVKEGLSKDKFEWMLGYARKWV